MTRAAVLRATNTPLDIMDIELAPTGPRQVRVRLTATGVCHSDLSLATGALAQPLPAVLGHEAAGTVVEVGDDVTSVKPGDDVILVWSPPCRECFFCTHGEPHLCERAAAVAPHATVAGEPLWPGLATGAFAEETVVGDHGVVPLPPGVPAEIGALIGCAVTTGVGAVLNTAKVPPNSTVVVIGCGGVGLSVIQGARLAGAARTIAVDVVPERLALATRLGATDVIDGNTDVNKAVRALTDGRGADHAFEVVGRSETIRLAYKLTRRGGTVTIVGVGRHDDLVSFSALELFYQARNLQGCVFGSADPASDFPRIAHLYLEGRLDLDRLVTHRVGLDGIDDAFARMAAGDGARTIVIF